MLISALIPTYNRRTVIFRAIESILSQTEPVDEIIIVDDGSTDGTLEAIRNRYGSIIKTFVQPNKGVSFARKRAVEEAKGEWVAFLDSDDEWLPKRNAAFLDAITQIPPQVAMIFGDTRFITDNGQGDTVFHQNNMQIGREIRIFREP